ncbi:MAG: hypothetical protein ACLP7A_00605 [Desulfobaccales bacterium]
MLDTPLSNLLSEKRSIGICAYFHMGKNAYIKSAGRAVDLENTERWGRNKLAEIPKWGWAKVPIQGRWRLFGFAKRSPGLLLALSFL